MLICNSLCANKFLQLIECENDEQLMLSTPSLAYVARPQLRCSVSAAFISMSFEDRANF